MNLKISTPEFIPPVFVIFCFTRSPFGSTKTRVHSPSFGHTQKTPLAVVMESNFQIICFVTKQ